MLFNETLPNRSTNHPTRDQTKRCKGDTDQARLGMARRFSFLTPGNRSPVTAGERNAAAKKPQAGVLTQPECDEHAGPVLQDQKDGGANNKNAKRPSTCL